MRRFFIFLILVSYFRPAAQNSKYNTALLLQENKQIALPLLVQSSTGDLKSMQAIYGFTWHTSTGSIHRITCSVANLARLADQGIITYAEYKVQTPQVLNDTMLKRSRILGAHSGSSPLSQAFTGSGVIFGMIDSGIDFNHPDFKDSAGNSRILYLWDQNAPSAGFAPAAYNYGREWTSTDINSNLCTHNDLALYGHGTHVAGIGAGNGLATGHHKGVAPDADIVAVALNFNSNGPMISDGVHYIFDKALQLGKPCVINISVGDYYGSHDGTDLETKLIENELIGSSGRALVGAAGNAGSIRYHTKTQVQQGDTLFTWLRNGGSQLYHWLYGDTNQVKNLRFSIGANRSNFSDLGRTVFRPYTYALNSVKTDTIRNNGNRIALVRTAGAINPSGVYELAVQIIGDTSNLLWRMETAGQGLHHAWNFSFVSSNLPTSGQIPSMSRYVKPDTLYSMVSGFQCSDEVITVSNYQNCRQYYDVKDSLRDIGIPAGNISSGSSLGPTRDERQKPDVSASGQIIFSAGVLSMLPGMISNSPKDVAQDSMHVIGGGTSAASPIVAGIGALYFQKNPTATHQDFKQALTTCAYRDQHTGNNLPNYQWGSGKADGKNTLLCGENLSGISAHNPGNFSVYPNPFHNKIYIQGLGQGPMQISLFDAQGQLIVERQSNASEEVISFTERSLSTGFYFLRINKNEMQYYFKLVFEK